MNGLLKGKHCSFGWESDGKGFFWDSYGVVLVDYLEKVKTITEAYHASSLENLKAETAEKWPSFNGKKIIVSPRKCLNGKTKMW